MATYKIDAMHSNIEFKVKHLMISTVTGKFNSYDATLQSEAADFSDASITFSAEINSISTGNEQRDQHLIGTDFFDAASFPTVSFASTSFTKKEENEYTLLGNLTLKGITKEVALAVEFGGVMTDFYGQEKAGFDIVGKINRKDFGLTWNGITEAGGVVLGDDIKLNFSVQMTKQ